MKDFRNELLEDLLAHSGEFIDIKYLTDKYCGQEDTFHYQDETIVRCRLKLNLVLRELKDMGWIMLYPQGGMSTAHTYNRELDKRQFIIDEPLKARMTTQGEIEYKKSKQIPLPQTYNDNSINVAGDVSGVVTRGDNNNLSVNHEKKSEKPKWLTLNFYWEELIKHWYKIILLAIGAYLLSWLRFNYSNSKVLNKQEQNKIPVQTDTLNEKDTLSIK